MMKYIDEFRDKKVSKRISNKIKNLLDGQDKEITLMEVCGTHTMSIFRAGIKSLLPPNINLLSGPGCPVCVTPNYYLDKAIAYSRLPFVIISTFGDMIKVPGSSSTLEEEKGSGGDIRVVYSPIESIKIAMENKDKSVIFLGVGFETTAPLVASSIIKAKEEGIKNLYVLSGHKLIPPAMIALLKSKELKIDGFICPGHVSTIIGAEPYYQVAEMYKVPSVITGFEPVDILEGILMLVNQIVNGTKSKVEIEYKRAVKKEGNIKALSVMNSVFYINDSEWRGMGIIPDSGHFIRDEFSNFDVEKNIDVEVEETKEHPRCICGDVLRGVKIPTDCSLFKFICNPENPVGPCMVSSEGTCAAYYKYGKDLRSNEN